jgi:hypothetical protein
LHGKEDLVHGLGNDDVVRNIRRQLEWLFFYMGSISGTMLLPAQYIYTPVANGGIEIGFDGGRGLNGLPPLPKL